MNIKTLKAYKIIEERDVADLNSKGYILEHIKTGARVLLLSNDDENKVFTIGFRTPASNSTGVPHIMEHSVLCGSKKFPAKDPFVELAKGSLNTFLNAMTYPDKTVYPVASCNDKDFQNLLDVYLDAVFYPNIYERQQIFKQEGWHYELESKEDEIIINGVVYNEMKGVFSSADDMLEREIMNSLFPDTTYSYESGGDPEVIPELSYQEFLDFHRKYYHPSNSYIYLYGDMDMAEKLDYIDREYLSKFDKLEIDSKIEVQKAFDEAKYSEISYSITNEEPIEDNTYLSYNTVIDTTLNKELYVAFQVIEYALLLAPGAILNQTLLDRGIGKDIEGSYECGTLQPYFSVIAKNSNISQLEEFKSTIKEVLKDVSENGFDKKSLLAAINYYEFKYREADFGSYPKGLMYGLQSFDSWLYDDAAPFMHIEQNETFKFLREQIDNNYFEDLVAKYLLNNNHASIVLVKPERGLTLKMDNELKEKLKAYKASLSADEVNQIVEDTKALKKYQEEASTKEELDSLPHLKIGDIKKEVQPFVYEEHKLGDTVILTQDIFTNGIGYLSLGFDITNISYDLFPYVGILKNILGLISTENYSYSELFNEININTGGITFGTSRYADANDSNKFKMMFEIRAKVKFEQLSFAFKMIDEVLFKSDFSDTKRIKELLFMLKSRLQASLPASGHTTAALRALSYSSKKALIGEKMGGVDFYHTIDELCNDFDSKKDELIEKLKILMSQIFTKEGLFADYTAAKSEYPLLEKEIAAFITKLYDKKNSEKIVAVECEKKNEGLKTASKVQYVAVAGNFKKDGLPYTGSLRVLKTMMAYDYLWINVRVKGGAYGCMNSYNKSGDSYLVSYRDPNLEKTLEIYKGAVKYLEEFDTDERDMTKYIIGTIAEMDTPLTPSAKGVRSMSAYLTGDSIENAQRERDEVLSTDVSAIRALSRYIESILKQNNICVVGSEEKIENSKDIFGVVSNLL